MNIENKIFELNQALELISKPTAKRLRLAADILMRVVRYERKGVCQPPAITVFRFEKDKQSRQDGEPRVKLKKYVCALCPSCGSRTFDLNTEIMQGSCLSCSFKSENYKADMLNRNTEVERSVANVVEKRTKVRNKNV